MDLAESVYRITVSMPKEERYGLTTQMRRAAVSIPANIAEGQGRRTDGEFLNQLSVAHGSIRELETHAILAGRLRFLDPSFVTDVLERAGEVGRLINGLANSFNRS
jgi:four helix bundle protein